MELLGHREGEGLGRVGRDAVGGRDHDREGPRLSRRPRQHASAAQGDAARQGPSLREGRSRGARRGHREGPGMPLGEGRIVRRRDRRGRAVLADRQGEGLRRIGLHANVTGSVIPNP